MSNQIVVVIDDLDDVGRVERSLVSMAVEADVGFHVVSLGTADALVGSEATPPRLRLMLLLARLADRLIPATGEVVAGRELEALTTAILRHSPYRIMVASRERWADRLLRRDLASRISRLLGIEVYRIPLPA